jgi:hypothetical protein
LGIATQKHGSPEAAFRLLGKAAMVSHRNHQKIFRREMERVAEFYRLLGQGENPRLDIELGLPSRTPPR